MSRARAVSIFGIWASNLFRISTFGFRYFPLLIEKGEHQLAFGDDGVVHHAAAHRLGQLVAARLGQLRVNEEGVTGENRFAKFDAIGAHEITDAACALADA